MKSPLLGIGMGFVLLSMFSCVALDTSVLDGAVLPQQIHPSLESLSEEKDGVSITHTDHIVVFDDLIVSPLLTTTDTTPDDDFELTLTQQLEALALVP